jgi:hypothetical protein
MWELRLLEYVSNLAIAVDILLSAVLAGDPGETLSGRAGSALLEGKLRGKIFAPIIDVTMHLLHLYPRWRGHCADAVANDKARAQAVLNQNV